MIDELFTSKSILEIPNIFYEGDKEVKSFEWHKNKVEQMEAFYDDKGKSSKKKIQEADINSLAKGLQNYLKKREKDAFKAKPKEGKDEKAEMKKMNAKARRNKWCIKYEHTGSVYEGVKANDDIEFDLMFVMNSKRFEKQQANNKYPGFYNITQGQDQRRRSVLNNMLVSSNDEEKMFLSPELVLQRFESMVTKYLNHEKKTRKKHEKESYRSHDRFVVKRHGPAIQVDFYKNKEKNQKSEKKEDQKNEKKKSEKDELWYHVDLVPCYQFKEGKEQKGTLLFKLFKYRPQGCLSIKRFLLNNSC